MWNRNKVTIFLLIALVLVNVLALVPAVTLGAPADDKLIPDIPNSNLPGVNMDDATDLVTGFIQILLGFAGIVAVLFLIIGGFQYVTSGANEELAETGKKTISNAIIGLVIILLSYVIVRVVITELIS